jgi:G3E family GTPase
MFLSEDFDRNRLPVILLSGFLGSGKTTLINTILRDPRMSDTAVAINEFGAVPIDHHLIDQGQNSTVVLGNGCLCCNVAGDLEDAVMRVFSRRQTGDLPAFRRLIVEPSGLADPAPIAQAILRNPIMSQALRLDGMITTVDAVFGLTQLERHPESLKQIGLADRLVLTKTDLAAPDEVERLRSALDSLNPAARIIEASFGAVNPQTLFPPSFLDPTSSASASPFGMDAFLAEPTNSHAHTHSTVALTLIAEQKLVWRKLEAWLRTIRLEFADRLLRLKGLVDLAEAKGPVVLQGVHHVINAPVELPTWPDDDHRTRIVLILQNADRAGILARWQADLHSILA